MPGLNGCLHAVKFFDFLIKLLCCRKCRFAKFMKFLSYGIVFLDDTEGLLQGLFLFLVFGFHISNTGNINSFRIGNQLLYGPCIAAVNQASQRIRIFGIVFCRHGSYCQNYTADNQSHTPGADCQTDSTDNGKGTADNCRLFKTIQLFLHFSNFFLQFFNLFLIAFNPFHIFFVFILETFNLRKQVTADFG